MLRVLSLGAGVQSSTMALMYATGVLEPMPDYAIFADTQGEPGSVYRWLEYLKGLDLPFELRVCTAGDLADDELKVRTSQKSGKRYIKGRIPAFMRKPNGEMGLLGRRCTSDYKIVPIQQECRRLLGLTRVPAKSGTLVEMAIGISLDEVHRIKPSQAPWIKNHWPLIDKRVTRERCVSWMRENGYPEPPRSACKYCPFHSDEEWIRLRDEEPEEFEAAARFEQRLQVAVSKQEVLVGIPFLHSSGVPLRDVKFESRPSHQQIDMFGNECEGLCGV